MEEIKLYQPEEVGYDSSQLKVVDELLTEQMNKGVIRCANYCIAREGKVFADHAIGKHSYREDDTRPLKPDAIQGTASVGKLFTAVAIFQLFEKGKIWVTQNISDIIPEYNMWPLNQIQIAHLLTHTSGFAVEHGALPSNGTPSVWELIDNAFESGDSDWLKASTKCELRYEIGTQWGYSSFGYILLGKIVENVTGMKLEEYIKKNVFEPCEMEDTSYGMDPSKLDRIIINDSGTEDRINKAKSGKISSDNLWALLPKGAGGAYTTALDLVKFGTMLLNNGTYNGKRVLGRKSVEKMTTVYTDLSVKDYCWQQPGTYRPYGLGPDMRRTPDCFYSEGTFFHEGAGKCALIMDPIEKMTAAYFVPYMNENEWDPVPIWNTHYVIWAGLK